MLRRAQARHDFLLLEMGKDAKCAYPRLRSMIYPRAAWGHNVKCTTIVFIQRCSTDTTPARIKLIASPKTGFSGNCLSSIAAEALFSSVSFDIYI